MKKKSTAKIENAMTPQIVNFLKLYNNLEIHKLTKSSSMKYGGDIKKNFIETFKKNWFRESQSIELIGEDYIKYMNRLKIELNDLSKLLKNKNDDDMENFFNDNNKKFKKYLFKSFFSNSILNTTTGSNWSVKTSSIIDTNYKIVDTLMTYDGEANKLLYEDFKEMFKLLNSRFFETLREKIKSDKLLIGSSVFKPTHNKTTIGFSNNLYFKYITWVNRVQQDKTVDWIQDKIKDQLNIIKSNKQKIEVLKSEVSKIQEKMMKRKEKLTVETKKFARVKMKLKALVIEEKELDKKIILKTNTSDAINEKMKQSQIKLTKLNKRNVEKTKEINELIKKNTVLDDTIKKKEMELDKRKNSINEELNTLKKEREKINKILKKNKDILTKIKKDKESLSNEINKSMDEKSKLLKEIEEQKLKKKKLMKEIQDIDLLKENVKKLEKEKKDLKYINDNLTEKLIKLQSEQLPRVTKIKKKKKKKKL